MQKIIICFSLILFGIIPSQSQYVEIKDTAFLFALFEQKIDKNNDSLISISEAEESTSLSVVERGIKDLSGIEAFTNLFSLDCSKNQISILDVSNNQSLGTLWCRDNQITELILNKVIERLNCRGNRITSLDFSDNYVLRELWCYNNQLTSLDLSHINTLERFDCSNNQIDHLDLSDNESLLFATCNDNKLTILDLAGDSALTSVRCQNNLLTQLDISIGSEIHTLNCSDNLLETLDLTKNKNLKYFQCSNNKLVTLDISENIEMIELYSSSNQLEDITLSENGKLVKLFCDDNKLTDVDISNAQNLQELDCSNNQLSNINLELNSLLEYLDCSNNEIQELVIPSIHSLHYLYCSHNYLSELDVSRNVGNPSILELDCSYNQLNNLNISDNDILRLKCSYNNITDLDLSSLTSHFILLDCSNNLLTDLNLSLISETGLDILNCENNYLTNLDLANRRFLYEVWCGGNQLEYLNLQNNSNIFSEGTLSPGKDFIGYLDVTNMVTLSQICVDESVYDSIGAHIDTTGSPNVYFTSDCTIGTNKLIYIEDITIYPNPTNSLVSINLKEPGFYKIEVSNSIGQLIYSDLLEGDEVQLDLSKFNIGIYFITVISSESRITKNVIKL